MDRQAPRTSWRQEARQAGHPGASHAIRLPPPLSPDAPQPSPDPHNFDGTWYHEAPLQFQITTDMFGYKLPFNDAGRKVSSVVSNRSRPAHRSSTRRRVAFHRASRGRWI
jgi:hypothetical protein